MTAESSGVPNDSVIEQERRRIAALLHDTLSQSLFSITLKLHWCIQTLQGRCPQVTSRMVEVRHETDVMLQRIRAMIGELTPDEPTPLSVGLKIRRLVTDFRMLTGVDVKLLQRGDLPQLEHRHAEALFAAVQEGLANIAKHSRASGAIIRVFRHGDEVHLEIADHGVGPSGDLEQVTRSPGHFGLRQMTERIQSLGGRVQVSRNVPSGFRLHVTIPVRASGEWLKSAS